MWNGLQPWHLIILLAWLGILVFGSRRLPTPRAHGKVHADLQVGDSRVAA